jgi:hypothetical protein
VRICIGIADVRTSLGRVLHVRRRHTFTNTRMGTATDIRSEKTAVEAPRGRSVARFDRNGHTIHPPAVFDASLRDLCTFTCAVCVSLAVVGAY